MCIYVYAYISGSLFFFFNKVVYNLSLNIYIFTVFLSQQLPGIFRFFGKTTMTTKNLAFFQGTIYNVKTVYFLCFLAITIATAMGI